MHPTHGGGGPGPGGGRAKKVGRRFAMTPRLETPRSGRNASPWYLKLPLSKPEHKLKPARKEVA
jgi:hypothetical protein